MSREFGSSKALFYMKSARALAGAVLVLASSAWPALAQYNSSSSGIHGVFPPAPVPAGTRYMLWDLKTGLVRFCSAYDTVARPNTCTTEISTAQIPGIPAEGLTSGVFEFSNVEISPAPNLGLDIYPVGYDGPTPLIILSQTSFRLQSSVVMRLDGQHGANTVVGLQPTDYGVPGGRPGPGGFAGGNGGRMGRPSTNGNAGFGPTGGKGGLANSGGASSGSHANPTPVATSLVPLVGGSGGGGGGAHDTLCGFRGAGGGGGGGGGALLIAANVQITLDGSINALGGNGGSGCSSGFNWGGNGSGGSVRLVAPTITGRGAVSVGNGIVRFEGNASSYMGPVDTTRGTVIAAPQPAIPSDLPVLRITSVGGIAVGQTPSGAISTPDVTFQTAPTGPVTVELAASNVPVGTVISLRANPLIGSPTTANSSALAGSLQSSTATAALQIPPGAGVITAVTSFPVSTTLLNQLPTVPGMVPTTVEVIADAAATSRVFMVGADAKRVELTTGPDGRFAVLH